MSKRAPSFDPEHLPPGPVALEGWHSGRGILERDAANLEFWAAKDTALTWKREAELEHCARCDELTLHVEVYWYTATWTYDPPLQTIDGRLVGGIEAPVVVLWCLRHRGDPPTRYPVPPPPGAKQ